MTQAQVPVNYINSLAASLLMLALPTGIAAQEGSVAMTIVVDTLQISVRDAVELGLRRNPAYLATRAGVDVAQGELRQAGTLPSTRNWRLKLQESAKAQQCVIGQRSSKR